MGWTPIQIIHIHIFLYWIERKEAMVWPLIIADVDEDERWRWRTGPINAMVTNDNSMNTLQWKNINYFVMRRCQWDMEDPKQGRGVSQAYDRALRLHSLKFQETQNPTMASQSHPPCALPSPSLSFPFSHNQSTTIILPFPSHCQLPFVHPYQILFSTYYCIDNQIHKCWS